jgi:thioredoxin-like negative regulator of GroEL
MNLLETPEQFEQLWFSVDKPIQGMESDNLQIRKADLKMRLSDKAWIVYFTAAWCNPCKALDLDTIVDAATKKNIPIWKCDDTINNYTGGYCGVRKLPTFILMRPKTIVSQLQSAKTQDVVDWINTHSV